MSLTQQLQNQERGVTFIQMPDGRGEAEGAQGPRSSDAQNHLLADARGLIATIQAMCDVTIGGRVLGAVGVQQINRNPSHLSLPKAGHHIARGDSHYDLHPLAAPVSSRLYREVARIALAVLRVLHSVVVD